VTEFLVLDPSKSIFYSKCDAIVNPVNCDGVMGKGLASDFKKKYPKEYFEEYVTACRTGMLSPGNVSVYINKEIQGLPSTVINFPTKKAWRDRSNIGLIESGLSSLHRSMMYFEMTSVGIPKIGCGLGGLDWDDVKKIILDKLNSSSIEKVEIYTT